MKHTFFLFSILLMSLTLFGQQRSQMQTQAQAKQYLGKTLLVGLPEPEPLKLEKLKKKDHSAYLESVKKNGQVLTAMVKKNWTFHEKIEFLPIKEAEEKAGSSDEYAILALTYVRWESSVRAAGGAQGQVSGSISDDFLRLTLSYQDHELPVTLPGMDLSDADATYGLLSAQYFLNQFIADPTYNWTRANLDCHNQVLTKKTLLVRQDQLKASVTAKDFTKLYPNNYKIVPKAKFDQAISTQDERYIAVEVVPTDYYYSAHFLYETSSGKIVGMGISDESNKNGQILGKSDLKKFKKYAQCK